MKSGYLQREAAKRKAYMDAMGAVMMQFMLDTLQCALHDEGFGYDRVMKITKRWGDKYETYYPALDHKDVEADYLRECLDRELRNLIRDKQEFYPFAKRYPEIKEITYGGGR